MSNIVQINSVLNDSLDYLDSRKDTIIDIISLIYTKDNTVEFLSTTTDLSLLYLLKRKVEQELELISNLQYPYEDTVIEVTTF